MFWAPPSLPSLPSLPPLVPQNPLGDAVSERCQEVIGRHNTSLEVLDIHSARMSTPAVSSVRYLPLSVHGSHTCVKNKTNNMHTDFAVHKVRGRQIELS